MKHLLFLQYGDFGADYRRFLVGGAERYRDQWSTVKYAADLTHQFRVTVLAIGDRQHDEAFSDNFRSIGIDIGSAYRARQIWPLLQRLAPDCMILRTPHRHAIVWARLRGIPTLPIFADMFMAGGFRHRVENRLLRWGLSGLNVSCISNHSLNASLSLHSVLKIPTNRIVPWDFPPLPCDLPPKAAFAAEDSVRLFYAGIVSEDKGIGDILQALANLKAEGLNISLDIAGEGDLAFWLACAARLGLEDKVRFLGRLENADVRQRMRVADMVVVPSRHSYAEGLPSTITEALAARTPLLISDHPAFAGRLRDETDCLIFRASDPEDLAQKIARLAKDPTLQITFSQAAPEALASLGFGRPWTWLATKFLDDMATNWQGHRLCDLLPDLQKAANPGLSNQAAR